MKNLIIIGGGPAGVSAALYAKMAGISVSIIHSGSTSLKTAEHIGNYYGFENGINGLALYDSGIKQAQNMGIEVIKQEVVGISFDESLTVKTASAQYSAGAIVLATGKSRNKPRIKNFDKFEGKGISYCAVCDGFFYRNKNIAIIGGGEYAFHEYEYLKGIAKSVLVFADGDTLHNELTDIANSEKITEFGGEDRLSKIITQSGSEYLVDGVFVAKGTADASSIAKSVGILANGGSIAVDESGATNVPGIFAAGDCTGGLAQISKSVSEGMRAGMAAAKYLKQLSKSV